MDVFLFALPLQHYLEYGTVVAQKIVREHIKQGQTAVMLIGNEANPMGIDQAVAQHNPRFVFLLGHGNIDVWSAECTEVYMYADSEQAAKMAGRVLQLSSCLTAVVLGPNLIELGAHAYFGSREEFTFYIGSDAGSDRASMTVFLAEYAVMAALLDGATADEAWKIRQNTYDGEIEYWLRGDGAGHPDADVLARALETDKYIGVFLGDPTAKITLVSGGIPSVEVGGVPVLPLALGLSVVGAVAYFGTKK